MPSPASTSKLQVQIAPALARELQRYREERGLTGKGDLSALVSQALIDFLARELGVDRSTLAKSVAPVVATPASATSRAAPDVAEPPKRIRMRFSRPLAMSERDLGILCAAVAVPRSRSS